MQAQKVRRIADRAEGAAHLMGKDREKLVIRGIRRYRRRPPARPAEWLSVTGMLKRESGAQGRGRRGQIAVAKFERYRLNLLFGTCPGVAPPLQWVTHNHPDD